MDIIKAPVQAVVELILKNGDIDLGNNESNIFDLAGNTAYHNRAGKSICNL
jgi:hypothetical protein